MAKGVGAAYNNLKTPKNDLSQSIQFWGQQQGQTMDRIAARNERGEVRKEKRFDTLREKLGFDEDTLLATATGQEHFDDVTRTFGTNAVASATKWEVEAARRLNEDGNIQGFYEALAKSKQVQYEMKNWNANAEKISTKIADYTKKLQEGKINPNDETTLMMDAIIKNDYVPIPDENGKLRLLIGVDLDKDGEVSDEEREAAQFSLKRGGKDSRFREVSPYDMIEGKFDPFQKVDITGEEGLINEFANSIGIIEKDKQSGLYINTYEGFDNRKKKELEANIKARLEDPETLSWVLTQATAGEEGGASKKASHNIDDYTKEEKEKAKNFLVNSTIAKYDTKETTRFDGGEERLDIAKKNQELREERIKDKSKTPEEEKLSNLHYDAKAFEEGDPTGLYGRYEIDGAEANITKAIDAGDHFIAIDEEMGQRYKIMKNSRSFIEFKLSNKDGYKGITTGDVYQSEPNPYRKIDKVGVSQVTQDFTSFFNERGRFNGDDAEFASLLESKYGVNAEDVDWLSSDIIRVNGVRIDLKNETSAMIKLDKAIGSGNLTKGIRTR